MELLRWRLALRGLLVTVVVSLGEDRSGCCVLMKEIVLGVLERVFIRKQMSCPSNRLPGVDN